MYSAESLIGHLLAVAPRRFHLRSCPGANSYFLTIASYVLYRISLEQIKMKAVFSCCFSTFLVWGGGGFRLYVRR